MTIKSTVSDTPCKKKELPFPKLMKDTKSSSIVFFTANNRGLAVAGKSNSGYSTGMWSDHWFTSQYKDFEGSICLENSDKI